SQSTSAANSALNSRSVAESTAASENTSANASESVNDSGLQSQSIVDSGNQSISGSTSITSEGSLSGSTPVADSVSSTNNGDTDKLLPALDIVLTHNAYIYQNDGITTLKENGKNIVLKFGKTIHAMNNGQIFTFNGKKFYRIGDNQYVKVSNTISYYYLVHNSFLYNKHGKTIKRNGKRILV
ncbi:SLAP domain-containing protein, partial [Lactobacillus amylovorus]